MPIRVLLVDDHERIRDAIGRHVSSGPDIEIVAMAHDFSKAMELCSQLRPDVVLMDVHMPDQKSVNPEQIKTCFSKSKLIAMSVWIDDETKALADSFGALVLLDKASLSADLIPVIKLCAKAAFSP
jgi:DNA-binding NarL/FixJ family response regulator